MIASWEMTQWLGFLDPDPYLSVGLADVQKERKKMKNIPVASKDEPTQFLSCTSILKNKV